MSWLVCQCEEGNPNDMYVVAIQTDATKTIQIKCNNDLSSFQLHFIITFVLTEPKSESVKQFVKFSWLTEFMGVQ